MAYADIIRDAIDRRKVLELRYKDVARKVRPHILGYVGEGELALSGWQISGTGAGWRLFHVNDISALSKTEQSFRGTARGYNRNDPAFSRIIDRI
ncbi:WYL domain-containing protein [Neorhizobium petrolearium]|uniref:WYL domain-containing protein n=1 Tax=Neorhizobium petrolearium TaxID=515361 RepID=UPI003F189666